MVAFSQVRYGQAGAFITPLSILRPARLVACSGRTSSGYTLWPGESPGRQAPEALSCGVARLNILCVGRKANVGNFLNWQIVLELQRRVCRWIDLGGYEIVGTEHSHEAATRAVALARAGEVEALMKGSLHTDELMAAVVPSATGLRTARRISHAFVLDVPAYPRPLMVTDAAINIEPTLTDKVDIVQNAIDLAHVLGVAQPKVAILAAVETVNAGMPSTLDAAALCKMADRGQITGGLLDGPLAFDNAISPEAAKTKKIVSPVAGQADILLVPNLEAGNMVAKQLQYLAGADSAGIVLGTRVPIVLTSRADNVRSRLASTAVMALVAHARRAAANKP